MTTTENKALEEADARLAAAEKRLKQARAARAQVLARTHKADRAARDRGLMMWGVSTEFDIKHATDKANRDELIESVRDRLDRAFAGGKQRDKDAGLGHLDRLVASLPPLEDDTKEGGQTTDTRGTDYDPRNL
jgi:hypothetical protein